MRWVETFPEEMRATTASRSQKFDRGIPSLFGLGRLGFRCGGFCSGCGSSFCFRFLFLFRQFRVHFGGFGWMKLMIIFVRLGELLFSQKQIVEAVGCA